MTESNNPPSVTGVSKPRKPGVAANLSLAISGLGQLYCGCLRRGLLHLCVIAALLAAAILGIALQISSPLTICIIFGSLLLLFTLYSTFDARKLALKTREDYRLKEYNAAGIYFGITFLFMTLVCGLGITLRENFVEVYRIPGDSMSPTLPKNTKVLVRKDAYEDRDPERNDLVAFLSPANRRQSWIKRVIGMPGELVEIRSGVVFINGEKLEEAATIRSDLSDAAEIIVPSDHCYVLGDHRASSKDSRHIGPVPLIALIGKVVFPRPE